MAEQALDVLSLKCEKGLAEAESDSRWNDRHLLFFSVTPRD